MRERRVGERRHGVPAPAFYASRRAGWRQWWTILHPPYTAWHLSYVVIGACLASAVQVSVLLATLLAFFLGVGVAAHVFDELEGRPLATSIPAGVLVTVGASALSGAIALGVIGVTRTGPWLIPFIAAGAFFVLAYDLELLGGWVHTQVGFAAAWGAFPVLTSYFAQAHGLSSASIAAAAGAFLWSWAQRSLSTPARMLRRQVSAVRGELMLSDGTAVALDRSRLVGPLESALKAMSLAVVVFATSLALYRLA